MKHIDGTLVIIFLITVMMIAYSFFVPYVLHASEALSGKLIVDFEEETAEYTESYDFSDEYEVEMKASVPENACNRCLRDNGGSVCLEVCGINN